MYLYATAGMRTLTYAAQDLIYSRVTSIFSRSGFAFDPENIGTITGTAEAYYGWVAVNFMSGAFKVDGGAGLGALDLGGASTQITVAVDAASPLPGLLTARFNGREYTLYAQSFLGYGANLFDDKMKAAAAANGGGNAPCLLRGTPAEFANYNNVTLVGGSSYTGCKEAAINGFLLAADSTCYAAGGGGGCAGLTEATCRCTIEGQGRPVIDTSTKFVGMSNFDNILAGNLKVPADGGWPAAAVASTEEFCGLNFTEAQAKLSGTSANYVASTCTTAVQATELMSTAYNLGSNTVAFKKDIGKFEVTWALGAMVSRANLLNAESPQPKLSPIESGAIGFGSAVAFGIVVVGLLVGSKRYVLLLPLRAMPNGLLAFILPFLLLLSGLGFATSSSSSSLVSRSLARPSRVCV